MSRAAGLVPAAYRPVLGHRTFRRLFTGFAVSYLGDGMSFVAVAWLAIVLAPTHTGLWVGGAVAAYTLPGVVGALALGRRLRRVTAQRVLLADNLLRAVFIGAVPVLAALGTLTPASYVVLLAISSLLHAWGSAATYSLLADLMPDEHRLAANTLVTTLTYAATIAGPALAGVLVGVVSPAYVLGLDAVSYLVLALVVARTPATGTDRVVAPVEGEAARGGFALLRRHPELLGLLALTWLFNLLYGPVEVALPLHVTDDLHAAGSVLGLYWALFGIGAVVGGLAVGTLRQLPLWPVTLAIVVGWGLCLLPFAFDVPTVVTVASFAVGGVVYGPFVPLSVTLMQARSPAAHLTSMLAARSAALLTASPLGTALGGPLTAAFGPRATLAASGTATVLLGTVAAVVLVAARSVAPRTLTNGER